MLVGTPTMSRVRMEKRKEPSFLIDYRMQDTLREIEEDKWQSIYIIYFTLGLGYLLSWNAFITTVQVQISEVSKEWSSSGSRINLCVASGHNVAPLPCCFSRCRSGERWE